MAGPSHSGQAHAEARRRGRDAVIDDPDVGQNFSGVAGRKAPRRHQFGDDRHPPSTSPCLSPLLSAAPRLRVSSSRRPEFFTPSKSRSWQAPLIRDKLTRRRGRDAVIDDPDVGQNFSGVAGRKAPRRHQFGDDRHPPPTSPCLSPLLSASPRLRVSSSRHPKAAHGRPLSFGTSSRGGAEARKGCSH
jgi:hypothetical protein